MEGYGEEFEMGISRTGGWEIRRKSGPGDKEGAILRESKAAELVTWSRGDT